ncbi:MAG TPA: hypothetical protein VL171_16585 [Verrucomicrobiae bacterium]|nr:hypothetical protein [Verrucomicrobiae bacterium]
MQLGNPPARKNLIAIIVTETMAKNVDASGKERTGIGAGTLLESNIGPTG